MSENVLLNSEEQYIKGYNEGYLIGKHLPELSAEISNAGSGKSDRLAGFRDGVNHSQMEKQKELFKPLFKTHDDMLKDKTDHSKEIEKDNIEPNKE